MKCLKKKLAYFKFGEYTMNRLSKLFIVLAILFSGQLMAASLSSAKDAGLIGEQADGYIGYVTSVPSDVRALVNDVNAKRKAHYQRIAKAEKISLSEVTRIGGKKAIGKTKRGNYIKKAGQGWSKK
ncbi:MAG: DUF1318 domain-containing protein [Gammaproteobacteria bacterium]|nr:MAG: DUF1318 domain-containing protein [Gammaproteobacteria bacterium]